MFFSMSYNLLLWGCFSIQETEKEVAGGSYMNMVSDWPCPCPESPESASLSWQNKLTTHKTVWNKLCTDLHLTKFFIRNLTNHFPVIAVYPPSILESLENLWAPVPKLLQPLPNLGGWQLPTSGITFKVLTALSASSKPHKGMQCVQDRA